MGGRMKRGNDIFGGVTSDRRVPSTTPTNNSSYGERIAKERDEILKQREVLRWKEEQDRIRREWEKQQMGEDAWTCREEDTEMERQRVEEEQAATEERRKMAEKE